MTARTGFGRQLRALTIGGPRGDATRRQHAETPAAKQLSDVI